MVKSSPDTWLLSVGLLGLVIARVSQWAFAVLTAGWCMEIAYSLVAAHLFTN